MTGAKPGLPNSGGYVGYIRKALEKGNSEHPGSACCTDGMFEIFVRFGRHMCFLLPLFVDRQLPCLHTNSLHALLLPPPPNFTAMGMTEWEALPPPAWKGHQGAEAASASAGTTVPLPPKTLPSSGLGRAK